VLNAHHITKSSGLYQFSDLVNFRRVTQNVTDSKKNVGTFTSRYDFTAVSIAHLHHKHTYDLTAVSIAHLRHKHTQVSITQSVVTCNFTS